MAADRDDRLRPGGPGALDRLRAARDGRRLGLDQRADIENQLFFEGHGRRPYLIRFAVLSVLSILIATYGVVIDSAPVVIGAMLIAPLITPLLALSAALVTGQPWRQWQAALTTLGAAVGSVAVAFIATASLPNPDFLIEQSSELLSRTAPGSIDLQIGLAAGAAGAYVTVHRQAVSALPGAAIAVALVPPLAVVGASLEIGRSDLAGGAALLFVTNLAAILLAAGIVFAVTGLVPRRSEGRFTNRTRIGLAVALIAVLSISYPLGRLTTEAINEAKTESSVREETEAWIGELDLDLAAVYIDEGAVRADLVGSDRPPPVAALERSLEGRLDREVEASVTWIPRRNAGAPVPEGLELPVTEP